MLPRAHQRLTRVGDHTAKLFHGAAAPDNRVVAQKIVFACENQLRRTAWKRVLRIDGLALTHTDPQALGQWLSGRPVRVMIGDQEQRPAVPDPGVNGLAFGRGKRRIRCLGKSRATLCVGNDEDLMRSQNFLRERLLVGRHAVTIIRDQVDEWLVQAIRAVKVVVSLVEEHGRMLCRIGGACHSRIVIEIDDLGLGERARRGEASQCGNQRSRHDASHIVTPHNS